MITLIILLVWYAGWCESYITIQFKCRNCDKIILGKPCIRMVDIDHHCINLIDCSWGAKNKKPVYKTNFLKLRQYILLMTLRSASVCELWKRKNYPDGGAFTPFLVSRRTRAKERESDMEFCRCRRGRWRSRWGLNCIRNFSAAVVCVREYREESGLRVCSISVVSCLALCRVVLVASSSWTCCTCDRFSS